MKFKILFLILAIWTIKVLGATPPNTSRACFSGHIKSNVDSIKLKAVFTKDYITGQGQAENIFFDIPVDKNGNFHFYLPSISHPGRLTFYDAYSNNQLFTEQLVEPGDHIKMDIIINDHKGYCDTCMQGRFSGQGASKYEYSQGLKLLGLNDGDVLDVLSRNDRAKCLVMADSIVTQKVNYLDTYASKISKAAFQILKADITGSVYEMVLNGQLGNFPTRGYFEKKSASQLVSGESFLNELEQKIKQNFPSSNGIIFSPAYTNFLYDLIKFKVAYRSNGTYQFRDLYGTLCRGNKKVVRDKLLAYCLLFDKDLYILFDYTSTEDFTWCLKNAAELIRTPWLKKPVEDLLIARGKNATALNFTLPADSSGKKVQFSDLKGKVILLDLYTYACSGCHAFSKAFHENVYPQFKDNPDFAVVSIMVNGNMREFMQRLREGAKTSYTYPTNINLYAGQDDKNGELIKSHYSVKVFPSLYLIDKEGRIYSSTLPFFEKKDSPNVKLLTDLIQDALNKP